jgi:choline-sulfatase
MKQSTPFAIFFTLSILFAAGLAPDAHGQNKPKKPNVLFIAVDDLNDWIGCLGGHPDAYSPNIDKLAARGVLFTNAHCQAPICNPSRTSFMLGMRPSTTGIYQNSPWFRATAANKNRVTMTQHFASQGYRTFTTGKIYHGSHFDPPSFQVKGPVPGQRNPLDKQLITGIGSRSKLWDFGPQAFDETKFNDYVDSSWAAAQLKKKHDKPFFITVGLYRPHVPFYAPTRVFNDIPISDVDLPKIKKDDSDDLPEFAKSLTNNSTPPPHEWFVKSGQWKHAVQSYLACVRFTDEQVGKMIKALDESDYADNTIVVFFSDHGFHLGEKNHWAKQSLWESSTRVPLIVSIPNGLKNARCNQPVELLSMFPTLIELCGIKNRKNLEGESIAPLLKNPDAKWNRPAITTYGKNNHAVRSKRWRYISYSDGSQELYDHSKDPHEWNNLLGASGKTANAELLKIISDHKKWLPKTNAAPAKRAGGKKPGKKGVKNTRNKAEPTSTSNK